ncbi:MAG TPA: hypothetical protein VNT51_03035 [Miltoncostaeaceae bacterium]|nr:hypothetical protein [Miltoncostaeaceae bacterium]
MLHAARIVLAAALALWLAGSAAAVPVRDVRATHGDGTLEVSAVVSSPPAGSGCAVAVRATWAPLAPAPRRGARAQSRDAGEAVPAGLVTKAEDDGSVRADACQQVGTRPMWTEGRVRLMFRPGRFTGAHRVCVHAEQRRGDGRTDAHRACTVVRPAAS